METLYAVTVVRSITTQLIVPAASAAEARKRVEDYGVGRAWADFPRASDSDEYRITAAKRTTA